MNISRIDCFNKPFRLNKTQNENINQVIQLHRVGVGAIAGEKLVQSALGVIH